MSFSRITPHRPERERKDDKQINQKKEIEKLKRQVTRLKKELAKYGEMEEDAIEVEPAETASAQPDEKCPECNSSDVRQLDLAGRSYKICGACKWRKKV